MGGMYTGKEGQERIAELLEKITRPEPFEKRYAELDQARDEGYQQGFPEGRQSMANEVIDALNGMISIASPDTRKLTLIQARTEVMRLAREGTGKEAA